MGYSKVISKFFPLHNCSYVYSLVLDELHLFVFELATYFSFSDYGSVVSAP